MGLFDLIKGESYDDENHLYKLSERKPVNTRITARLSVAEIDFLKEIHPRPATALKIVLRRYIKAKTTHKGISFDDLEVKK